jgi:hypothetical protein
VPIRKALLVGTISAAGRSCESLAERRSAAFLREARVLLGGLLGGVTRVRAPARAEPCLRPSYLQVLARASVSGALRPLIVL